MILFTVLGTVMSFPARSFVGSAAVPALEATEEEGALDDGEDDMVSFPEQAVKTNNTAAAANQLLFTDFKITPPSKKNRASPNPGNTALKSWPDSHDTAHFLGSKKNNRAEYRLVF